jgi:hypothetical protein
MTTNPPNESNSRPRRRIGQRAPTPSNRQPRQTTPSAPDQRPPRSSNAPARSPNASRDLSTSSRRHIPAATPSPQTMSAPNSTVPNAPLRAVRNSPSGADASPRAVSAPHPPGSPRGTPNAYRIPPPEPLLLAADPDQGSEVSQGLDMLREELALASISTIDESVSPGPTPTPLRLGHPLRLQDEIHVTSFATSASPPIPVVTPQVTVSPPAPASALPSTPTAVPSPAFTSPPAPPVPLLVNVSLSTVHSIPPTAHTPTSAHGIFATPTPAMWNENSFFYIFLTDVAQLSVLSLSSFARFPKSSCRGLHRASCMTTVTNSTPLLWSGLLLVFMCTIKL